jgi:hypothetical protein
MRCYISYHLVSKKIEILFLLDTIAIIYIVPYKTMSGSQQQANAKVIEGMIHASVDKSEVRVTETITSRSVEVMLKLESIDNKVDTILKLLSEDKKQTGGKKSLKTTESSLESPTPVKEEKPPKAPKKVASQPEVQAKGFPISAYQWHAREFKASEEFRAKYVDDVLTKQLKDLESTAEYTAKKDDAQKLTLKAKTAWEHIKSDAGKALKTTIDNDYKSAKDALVSKPSLSAEADI